MMKRILNNLMLIMMVCSIIFCITAVAVWDDTYNSVDNNTSDVDSSADKGSESSFSNCQEVAPDSDYMTIQESDYGYSAVNENLVVTGYTATTNQWTPTGSTPYLGADDGTNYIATATTAYTDRWFTYGDTANTGSGFSVVLYVDFDAGDGDDDVNWAVDTTGDDTAEFSGTFSNPTTSIVNTGTISGLDTQTEINAARLSLTSVKGGSKMNTLNVDYSYLNVQRSATVIYNIDFEYQWTTADYGLSEEIICINVGSHTGSETLNVDYYNSGWTNLGSITATGWTNFTVAVASATYTIRFIGATEGSDGSQDSWTVDCLFYRCYDDITVYNNTVNVTGKYEIIGTLADGLTFYINFTGDSCPPSYELYLYDNIVDATGTHEYNINETGYQVWANYTGDSCPPNYALYLYDDIEGATGTHESNINDTGYQVWANYTGDLECPPEVDNSSENWVWISGLSFEPQVLIFMLLSFLFYAIHKISYQYAGVHVPIAFCGLLIIFLTRSEIETWFTNSFHIMMIFWIMIVLFAGYKDYEGYVRR